MNVSASDRADLLPGRGSGSSAPLAAPRSRGHDCLLHVCRIFNAITGLCALLCAMAFGMAMWVRSEASERVRCWAGAGARWVLGAVLGACLVLRRRLPWLVACCWRHANCHAVASSCC